MKVIRAPLQHLGKTTQRNGRGTRTDWSRSLMQHERSTVRGIAARAFHACQRDQIAYPSSMRTRRARQVAVSLQPLWAENLRST